MTFTKGFEAFAYGQKGGQVRSEKKKAAARRNARKGGRPVKRSLLEKLLERPLTDAQEAQVKRAVSTHMHIGDIQRLAQHFEAIDLDTKNYTPRRGVPRNLRLIVEMLRVVAKHSIHPTRPRIVSPYVVEYQTRPREEQDQWEQRYAHCDPVPPCPPRRVSIDVRRLEGFNHFQLLYARNPNLTASDIMKGGGAKWTERRAEHALKYIKALAGQQGRSTAQ